MQGRGCDNYKAVLTRKLGNFSGYPPGPKSELVGSVNLKKIHVSNKLQPQELSSRGYQKVNILMVSYSSIK